MRSRKATRLPSPTQTARLFRSFRNSIRISVQKLKPFLPRPARRSDRNAGLSTRETKENRLEGLPHRRELVDAEPLGDQLLVHPRGLNSRKAQRQRVHVLEEN